MDLSKLNWSIAPTATSRIYKAGAARLRRAVRKKFGDNFEVFQFAHGQHVSVSCFKWAWQFEVLGSSGMCLLQEEARTADNGYTTRCSTYLGTRFTVQNAITHMDWRMAEGFEEALKSLNHVSDG